MFQFSPGVSNLTCLQCCFRFGSGFTQPSLFLWQQISRMQVAWATYRAPTQTSPTPAPTALGSCPSGQVVFRLQLTTDASGAQTSWELANGCNNQAFVVGNGNYGDSTTYTENYCVTSGQQYSFFIYDAQGGKSWCCFVLKKSNLLDVLLTTNHMPEPT